MIQQMYFWSLLEMEMHKISVCPIYTNGTNIDLKQWDQSRRITPPDNINVHFIQDKLNTGR